MTIRYLTGIVIITNIVVARTAFASEDIFTFPHELVYFSSEKQKEDQINACLSANVILAQDNVTIEELRESCLSQPSDPLNQRRALEKSAENNPFALIPYKPNYILPVTYSDGSTEPYKKLDSNDDFDDVEVKFQVSLKYIVAEDIMTPGLDVELGFTAVSWWQAYNSDSSSPFRETNYEPEIIMQYTQPWDLFGLPVAISSISLNHQSNGQSGSLSRSWNRIIGTLAFTHNDFVWAVRGWWRLPEDEKETPDSSRGDDNPDIEKYLGYGDLNMVWKLPYNHNLDFKLRNNLRTDNKGSVQVGWSFPLSKHLFGYVEYFNGYGESLIYYNQSVSRIGVGFRLTNWL